MKQKILRAVIITICIIAIILILLICIELGSGWSSGQEPEISEFQLVSCKVVDRPITNNVGGVLGTRQYIEYTCLNLDGTVKMGEKLKGTDVEFQLAQDTSKLVIAHVGFDSYYYMFCLTEDMYKEVYSE